MTNYFLLPIRNSDYALVLTGPCWVCRNYGSAMMRLRILKSSKWNNEDSVILFKSSVPFTTNSFSTFTRSDQVFWRSMQVWCAIIQYDTWAAQIIYSVLTVIEMRLSIITALPCLPEAASNTAKTHNCRGEKLLEGLFYLVISRDNQVNKYPTLLENINIWMATPLSMVRLPDCLTMLHDRTTFATGQSWPSGPVRRRMMPGGMPYASCQEFIWSIPLKHIHPTTFLKLLHWQTWVAKCLTAWRSELFWA